MKIFSLNCGSSSIKYKLIDTDAQQTLIAGLIERIGAEQTCEQGIHKALSLTENHRIDAIGHRVVHGGEHFHKAVIIDQPEITKIRECIPLAPLHNTIDLDGIVAAMKIYPRIPHVAVFDTSFHSTMPKKFATYGVSTKMAQKYNLRKFGFHGISHRYVCEKAAAFLNTDMHNLRITSCHLGSGASTCAVAYGRAVDTGMGRTPLEGLLMGTRSGDLDPSIVLQPVEEFNGDLKKVDDYLNKECGLKGIGGADDMRNLEAMALGGDKNAGLAIQVFAHRVRKYIGSHFVTMGGCDCVLLTGGIGENSASARMRTLQRLDFMGLRLDEQANINAAPDTENPVAEISSPQSLIKALVVKTDEEQETVNETGRLIAAGKTTELPRVQIVAKTRHAFLDRETFEQLFGPPTPRQATPLKPTTA